MYMYIYIYIYIIVYIYIYIHVYSLIADLSEKGSDRGQHKSNIE